MLLACGFDYALTSHGFKHYTKLSNGFSVAISFSKERIITVSFLGEGPHPLVPIRGQNIPLHRIQNLYYAITKEELHIKNIRAEDTHHGAF